MPWDAGVLGGWGLAVSVSTQMELARILYIREHPEIHRSSIKQLIAALILHHIIGFLFLGLQVDLHKVTSRDVSGLL